MPGALLATGGLALLAYSLSGPRVLTAASIAAAAAVLLGLFVLVEARLARAPLLPPRLLRPRPIWLGNLAMLMAGATLNPMWYFLTLSLQHVLGYGPLQTGLAFLPHTLLTILVGLRLTPWLMRRADHRVLIAAGALIGAAGFLWQSRLAPGQDYVTAILGPAMLISLGGGLLNTPLTVTVTSGVPAQDAGAASGLMNTAKQIGGALGLAALVTATAGHNGESGSPAQTQAQELAAGFGQAFVAIAVTLAAVALLAAALPKRPHAAAPRRAGRLAARPLTGPRPVRGQAGSTLSGHLVCLAVSAAAAAGTAGRWSRSSPARSGPCATAGRASTCCFQLRSCRRARHSPPPARPTSRACRPT
ncbi:MFS transporter [Nonomuraea sp. NPDC049758]|uniref:MFS transporter n=1 Tax=Nonomuraea sp. NPDC049758 TaxID=3154360 RepID=UPI00342BAF5E